jgi:hypothetical protein
LSHSNITQGQVVVDVVTDCTDSVPTARRDMGGFDVSQTGCPPQNRAPIWRRPQVKIVGKLKPDMVYARLDNLGPVVVLQLVCRLLNVPILLFGRLMKD